VQAEDGIRVRNVTGVQTCALPILSALTTLISVRMKALDFILNMMLVSDSTSFTLTCPPFDFLIMLKMKATENLNVMYVPMIVRNRMPNRSGTMIMTKSKIFVESQYPDMII